ncbi:MAG: GNAT family N-acetyltransferase [Myxococcales bacterium]|nr:GNAT family N-acetyltransferase [Myxococcales bacterium]
MIDALQVRAMQPADWPQASAIYAAGIAEGDATFEREVPAREAFFAKTALRLVAARGETLLGFCVTTPVSTRPVYRGVAEVSLYVAPSARGEGVGTRLLDALREAAAGARVWTLQAGIFPENGASIRLFSRAGFRLVGRRERLGAQRSESGELRWRDVLLYERREAEPAGEAAPPLSAAAAPHIRAALTGDDDGMWRIFSAVVAGGDTYPYPPDTDRAAGLAAWRGKAPAEREVFVAERDGEIVGTYTMAPNQLGLGDHVAHCGYMVAPSARGGGIGRALCEHSLAHARARGFRAMQFNLVVASNEGAVRLWQRLGFEIVGTLPGAFRHAELGFVDAYVMFRSLL